MNGKNNLKFGCKSKITFFFLGIMSTIWFLIRVIPKPSRSNYPCMRAAAPFMSAFILYLLGLTATLVCFRKYKTSFLQSKFMLSFVFVAIALFSFTKSTTNQLQLVELNSFVPNAPVGVAKGIYPGRVVWVHDPSAVNQSYDTLNTATDDYWDNDVNNNQKIIDSMLNAGIEQIAGQSNINDAWDAIFKYFNNSHGKGNIGYTVGENIAVKINLVISGETKNEVNASPQLCLSLLKQLIEVVGVNQQDIWFGDTYKTFQDVYWNKCHSVYPNVHYVDGTGVNGREKTVPSSGQLLVFSDGIETSSIPQHYIDASYFINMPCLKTHNEGGITLTAKTHQGSVLQSGTAPENQSAQFMHPYLPADNPGYGKYRHFVDYMGHKDLGGKTLLFIVDGLWAGENFWGYIWKWQMAPFNNQYPASLFISQDHVAIDAVCFDFLLAEYARMPSDEKYPYILGTDDYLLQAADSSYWPSGLKYNPEGNGIPIGSLGVYEHWNNSINKQYSRNLGIGNGIELKSNEVITSVRPLNLNPEIEIYPNPFSKQVHIKLNQEVLSKVKLNIYNFNGQLIFQSNIQNNGFVWKGTDQSGKNVKPGAYIVSIANNKVIALKNLIYLGN